MSKQVNVFVEYCGACGYEARYLELRALILLEVPEAQVESKVGSRSSFEVSINGKQVFSKWRRNAFPKFEKVVEEVRHALKDEDVNEVTELQEGSSCSIL